jgi:hypothetical protein
MRKSKLVLCAFALSAGANFASSARAADDADFAAIRQEMKALRGDYENKIRELERRLQAAEQRAKAAEAQAATAVPLQAPVAPPTPLPAPVPRVAGSANAFNPSISVVLNGSFAVSSEDPAGLGVAGFALGEEAGLRDRGFSLGESEVAISANVDHAFFASLIVALGNDDTIGVEEGFIQTTSLPWGLTVKAGCFFSGIGYLNEKHAHAWEFADAPLPYRAMLENQYGDDGIGVRWLAPTDFFLEFGAEWFRGDAFPAGGADDNGAGTAAAYVRSGGDIDEESSFLAGLSFLRTKADERDTDGDIFTGTSDLAIASLVYKWAPNGNPAQTNLTFSGEYFFGREEGAFNGVGVDYERSGFYVQGVYQFMPRWRAGVRHAQLRSDDAPAALAGSVLDNFGHTPRATSALLEYDSSEFGRFRAQYTLDDADLQTNDEFVFSYTVSFGAHGAHSF